jgi:hypothetical protein
MIYADDEKWLPNLVAEVWPGRTTGESGPTATTYTGAITTVTLTNRYFRAIAKIAFHYFLSQFAEYRGDEPIFGDIREFIRDENAAVDRANTFIGRRQHPLLGEMLPAGARPDGWRAHVLAAELKNGEAVAHVQLFLTEDWPAPIYTVRVGRHPDMADRQAAGHAYVHYADGPHGQYVGEARPLGTTVVDIVVAPPVPVVRQ